MKKEARKNIIKGLITAFVLVLVIFAAGRFGWRLFGFAVCESAGVESVEVTDGQVRLVGFYPGSFPQGFIGYHSEEENGKLYVGFRFGGLFGAFSNGDFDISIPVESKITEVIVKSRESEHVIWEAEPKAESVKEPEHDSDSVAWEEPKKELAAGDEPKAEVAQEDTAGAYRSIIDKYRTAVKENWTGQQLTDAGMSIMVRDVAGSVGYMVNDIDGDGVSELLIGSAAADDFYGKLVFALYTLDENGDAVQLFSSRERDRYYYAGDIRFANLGSSSAADSYVTTLKLEDKEMIDMTYTTDPADYVQPELTMF